MANYIVLFYKEEFEAHSILDVRTWRENWRYTFRPNRHYLQCMDDYEPKRKGVIIFVMTPLGTIPWRGTEVPGTRVGYDLLFSPGLADSVAIS